MHTVIHANEGVPSDIKFTSAATNDSLMLRAATFSKGDMMALDRAYIDYENFSSLRAWSDIRHQNEEKPEIPYSVGYDVSDSRGFHGDPDTACGVRQAT